jgi:hypothetical protein
MADEADQADYNIERDKQMALALAAAHKPEAEYTGSCLNCGEETGFLRRWCDADCRDKWQRRQLK